MVPKSDLRCINKLPLSVKIYDIVADYKKNNGGEPMIYIGVTGWGDHDSLYATGTSPRDKLKEYAGHFPIVEVDASFYALYILLWGKTKLNRFI